jgi:thiosulfate dehydrogenase [quinone] large subunit
MNAELFGRNVTFEYSEKAIAYSIVLLRVVMGWILFQGGITKVLDPNWTAAGFLANAIPEGNPLMGFWASLAGSPVIDALNAWGLTLTGLGLILGAFVRWNAFWGAVIMLFYWAASLSGGLFQGFPIEHGWLVDDHIVYAALLFGLGAIGAGRVLGFDAIFEKIKVVRENRWMEYVLG